MDKDRQLRMLIPPFFVIASLLWAAHLSGLLDPYLHAAAASSGADYLKFGFSLVGLVGVTTLPMGYAIGIVTIGGLRCFGWLFPLRRHDLPVSKQAMGRIWKYLESDPVKRLNLCAMATFDHAYLQPRIHEWIVRRWTAFHIASQCATALMLSVLLARCLHIPLLSAGMWKWSVPVAVLVAIFICHSFVTWIEVRDMFDFAVEVPKARRSSTSLDPLAVGRRPTRRAGSIRSARNRIRLG